jgi:hypothetical protein
VKKFDCQKTGAITSTPPPLLPPPPPPALAPEIKERRMRNAMVGPNAKDEINSRDDDGAVHIHNRNNDIIHNPPHNASQHVAPF